MTTPDTPANPPPASPADAPLQSPMPRSDSLDREEPAFADEADLPAPPAPTDPQSVAGEEDPGAGLDDGGAR